MTNEESIKILDNYHNGYFGYKIDDVIVAHKKAIEALKNERPNGKWVYERPNGKTYSDFVYCSECQKPNGFYKTNYCPNCGSDMRGETDE